jgi:hypothetical protein
MQDPQGNPSQHWFVIDLVEKIFEGPLTIGDLKTKLIEGKIFWSDIAMCPAKDFSWVRLFEIRELVELCPPLPPPEVLKHFRNVGFRQTEYARLPVKLPDPPAATKRPAAPEAPVPPRPADPVARVSVSAPAKTPAPAPTPASAARPASRPASKPRPTDSLLGKAEWHLLIDDNEGGPFTLREIETAFKAGKKPERAYVWKTGMKRWRPIGKVAEFKHLNVGAYGADFAEDEQEDELEMGRNVRRSFRKSFVASVLRISETGIRQMIGVCGNITVDGLHLFQDQFRVQYPLKSQHLLEIKPLKLMRIPPFRVMAEVRWMDPDTHGIGFQFMEISPTDQQLLQRYLASVS